MATKIATPEKKTKQFKRSVEQFDLNTATVAGTIIRLWGRSGDVFARLRVSLRGELREKEDTQSIYVTIRIPDGTIAGNMVTLQSDDVVLVKGYLTHTNYDETLRKFLNTAGEAKFLEENIPPEDLSAWRTVQFKRQNAVLNAIDLTSILEGDRKVEILHSVDLEGIVARTWEDRHDRGVDLFLRLAIYDEWTTISREKQGNFGRPFRIPHYVNILLPDGKTAQNKPVNIAVKQRIRVRGELRDKGYRVTLRDSLMSLGSSEIAEMMGRVINAEKLQEISAQQESLHVLANAVIVYG